MKDATIDYQDLFNLVVVILGFIGGWLVNTIWSSLRDLQETDKELAEKVAAIEVLVAGQYMTREEFNSAIASVVLKLDRIQDTLNKKVDR